jgi:hypothetical protein
MQIQPAVIETCACCGARKRISDEVYGCDECRAPMDMNTRQSLDVTVHRHGGEAEHLRFCSWACCMAGLRKVRTDYFVSLPLLLYDDKTPGLRVEDFVAELRAHG